MTRLLSRLTAVALPATAVLAVAALAGAASAHEPRTQGGLRFVVGWGDEPAYTGVKNSVQVTITDGGDSPVTDLGGSLHVEVIKGSERTTIPLVPHFGEGGGAPGDYRAWLTPTRPGAYTFRLTGTVRGQSIDQSFSSSSTTFNDVEDAAIIQFPAKDPTPGQLATRVDREIPRLQAGLRKAEDKAGRARTFGLIGLSVGVMSLVAAQTAYVAARRSRRRGPGGQASEPPRAATFEPEPLGQ